MLSRDGLDSLTRLLAARQSPVRGLATSTDYRTIVVEHVLTFSVEPVKGTWPLTLLLFKPSRLSGAPGCAAGGRVPRKGRAESSERIGEPEEGKQLD